VQFGWYLNPLLAKFQIRPSKRVLTGLPQTNEGTGLDYDSVQQIAGKKGPGPLSPYKCKKGSNLWRASFRFERGSAQTEGTIKTHHMYTCLTIIYCDKPCDKLTLWQTSLCYLIVRCDCRWEVSLRDMSLRRCENIHFSLFRGWWRKPNRKEGTWTRPDYLVNRDDKKIEGPFGQKICTEIENIVGVWTVWVVGA